MPSSPLVWDGVLRRLGAEMPAFALDAWLRPLVAEAHGDELRLLCPTPFHRDRVRDRFLAAIERCAAAETGQPLTVHLALGAAPASAGSPAPTGPQPTGRASPDRPRPAPRPAAPRQYRFDNFVVGSCNALAREASLAVARDAQRRLNPLCLYGESGMGKTHLARAIVGEALPRSQDRVLYASAETFTNEFTAALRARRMEEFKRRFRNSCDLLVVEDVQFLGTRRATQLELFHTLMHLVDAGARVVLTSDRLPRDIAGLDPRLGSQIAAGFVVELEAPDAQVRRQILASKAAAGGVRLPDDCLDLLVDRVRGNVRDLIGVLTQLVASSALLKRPIDPALTAAALHKLAPEPREARPLDPAAVIRVVAAFFKTTPETLASRSRRRDVLVPRQLAMYLCRRYTDEPLGEIGRAFGRAHPAVTNAVRSVEARILERAPLRYQVEALTVRLDALRGR